MKFVDLVDIHVIAGHGGPGAVSFRREKYVPKGGPDGGNGGKGGDVILVASSRVQTLLDLKFKRIYKAKSGASGKPKNQFGAAGADLVLEIPIGTMVWDENNQLIVDMTELDQKYTLAKGGMGGRGNATFSTSTHRAPRFSQPGMPGEEHHVRLELKMIAQVGLVGLPNAGKSTLLKTLTNAKAKVGAYPFTTLYPNLGVLHFPDSEIIIADIPGLIEGASEGHGLGIDFLRHISRTQVIVHLVSAESGEFPTCWQHYQTIISELKASKEDILGKPQLVVLSKIDTIEAETLQNLQKQFIKKGVHCLGISGVSLMGIDSLKNKIYQLIRGASET